MAGFVGINRCKVQPVRQFKVGSVIYAKESAAEAESVRQVKEAIIVRVRLAFEDLDYEVAQDSIAHFNEAIGFLIDNK